MEPNGGDMGRMNLKDYEEIKGFLKIRGFKVERPYDHSDEIHFSKIVKTEDPDIKLRIFGELNFHVSTSY